MKVVIGLGNPGSRYVFTRHNAGYLFLDYVSEKMECSPWSGERFYMYSSCENLFLAKPSTYMNLSGSAFPYILRDFSADVHEILVVYDDVSLPLGKIRIRKSGSDGGHNGVKSIISVLERTDFPRMRIGIGLKPKGVDLASYVLSEFSDEELEKLYKVFSMAYDALLVIIKDGMDKAMSLFNSKEVVG